MSHTMNLNMIWMPIATVPVITSKDISGLFAQNFREFSGRLIYISRHECSWLIILWPTSHPTVVVAQPIHSTDAKHRSRIF